MVKWNIVRCFFVFAGIIYVAVDMNHVSKLSTLKTLRQGEASGTQGIVIEDFTLFLFLIFRY
jgi:hypothetical protein